MNDVVRHLARHQWVRLHGTPRVSVLVGGEHARAIWHRWLAVYERTGTLLDGTAATPARRTGARLDDTAATPARRTGTPLDGTAARPTRTVTSSTSTSTSAGTPPRAREPLDAAFDELIRDALTRATTDPTHRIAVLVAPDVLARWRHGRDDRLAAFVDEGRIDIAEPTVGAKTVGATTVGATTVGAKTIGAKTIGAKTVGAKTVGAKTVGAKTVGAKTVDAKTIGAKAIATNAIATNAIATDTIATDTIATDDIANDDIPTDASEDGIAGVAGVAGVAAVAADVAAEIAAIDARSAAEAALFEALEATPATAGKFELNGSLTVRHGPRAAEVDLLARGERVAVEIDGVHHFADPECYRRDRRKDLMMQAQGLLVVRLLAEDVLVDVRESVTIVCQALAYRRRLDAS